MHRSRRSAGCWTGRASEKSEAVRVQTFLRRDQPTSFPTRPNGRPFIRLICAAGPKISSFLSARRLDFFYISLKQWLCHVGDSTHLVLAACTDGCSVLALTQALKSQQRSPAIQES